MNRRLFRRILTVGLLGLFAGFLAFAFRPQPVPVDIGTVTNGPMNVTVAEEAKTRVRDVYVVSAPVTGRLLRIEQEAGDAVEARTTIVAAMLPSDPSFLDVRSMTEAEAGVRSATAALALAKAEVNKAAAEVKFAELELKRARELVRKKAASKAALDRAELELRSSEATLQMSRAAVQAREADLETARARLIDPTRATELEDPQQNGIVSVRAPVSGRILRLIQESETVVTAGTALIEIGDPRGDLEIVVELLSTDAVQVKEGNRVIIEKWGGEGNLAGIVDRIEPFGFTKVSALGVEEQRVNVILQFTGPPERRVTLGHGFRVDVRIVVWEEKGVVRVPSSALFRDGDAWAVFKYDGETAQQVAVKIGRNNGVVAQVLDGLSVDDQVVLYPSDQVSDGVRIASRAEN